MPFAFLWLAGLRASVATAQAHWALGSGIGAALARNDGALSAPSRLQMAKAKKPAKARAKRASALKAVAPAKEATSEPSVAAPASPAPSVSEYAVGDQIFHPMFGGGTVKAMDGDNLTIKFAGNITKSIRADFVKPR